MTNKYDTLAKKHQSKSLKNRIEVDDFLTEIIRSEEIKKIAPIYTVQGVPHPNPIFYLGSKDHLEDLMKAEFYESERKIDKIRIEKVYLYLRSTNYDILCIEKISESYDGGFGSYDYLKISEDSEPKEIRKFIATLTYNHMIEAGFVFNKEYKELIDHTGDKIKSFNLKNLQRCLEEYLIKPGIENEVFNHRDI
jgi:hypothetical protein